MEQITPEHPESKSADMVEGNIDRLKELFPDAFTEGKVDFEVLKQLLGGAVDEREEKYGLNWHGKRKARQLALTPSMGTLKPCKEESVDWDTTGNLFIEGDNLEVLKLLQKSYAGRVKMIYIDPPYNTGKDFVYPDDFRDNIKNYLELTGQTDDEGRKISTNAETSGRFHTDWLNMMYPRLKIARELLRNDGVIFISIDEGEAKNLKCVCDEILGEENFIAQVVWEKMYTTKNDSSLLSQCHEYVLTYVKTHTPNSIYLLPRTAEMDARYTNPDNDDRGVWKAIPLYAKGERRNGRYAVVSPKTGKTHLPQPDSHWLYAQKDTEELISDDRIYFGKDGNAQPNVKRFLTEVQQGTKSKTLWKHNEVGSNDSAKRELRDLYNAIKIPFDFPKPTSLMNRMIQIATKDNTEDIILDFFAGSGSTAHSILKANMTNSGNRKYILVQLPEIIDIDNKEQKLSHDYCKDNNMPCKITELTKDRLKKVSKKIREENPDHKGDLGFRVFKLDTSNIHAWDANTDNIEQSIDAHIDNLKHDRTEEDILYELLLKLGLNLSVPIETKSIASHTVYSVGNGRLTTCLSKSVKKESVEELAEGMIAWLQEMEAEVLDGESDAELKKARKNVFIVFRDSAFADNVAKTNLTAILKQEGYENIRSI